MSMAQELAHSTGRKVNAFTYFQIDELCNWYGIDID